MDTLSNKEDNGIRKVHPCLPELLQQSFVLKQHVFLPAPTRGEKACIVHILPAKFFGVVKTAVHQ